MPSFHRFVLCSPLGLVGASWLLNSCQAASIQPPLAMGMLEAPLAQAEQGAPPAVASNAQAAPLPTGPVGAASASAATRWIEGSEQLDLTARAAVELALGQHPALTAAEWDAEARRHDLAQAQRWQNPVLRVDVENFAGSGAVSGLDAAELTLWLEQNFAPQGQRKARRRLGETNVTLSEADRERVRLDVAAAAEAAFARALAADQELELARAVEARAERFEATVRQLVNAGKAAAVEHQKASIAHGQARVGRVRAERASAVARSTLERTIGGAAGFADAVRFPSLVGGHSERTPPRPLEELRAALLAGSRLGRWEAEFARGDAQIALARAARSGLGVALGLRRLEATDDTAAVLSVGLPLPLLDRRRDAVNAAQAQRARIAQERRLAELQLNGRLERAWTRQMAALEELAELEERLLPESDNALAGVQAGYRAGKFTLIEVLDMQRTLAQLRSRRVAVLLDYQLAAIEIRAVVGSPAP